MEAISRNEFRHNFLKSVIVRLDFQGVLESELEKVLIHVKPFAKEKGFSRYTEKSANQIDIAVKDQGMHEPIETTNRVRRQKVYSFIDETRGFILDISSTFICLTINTTHYVPFDEYSDIVPVVSSFYNDSIDFFTVTRFGIRKINECLIEDKSQIQSYFNPSYFNYYDQIEGLDTIQSDRLNIFTFDKYRVNLITNIAQGKLEEKLMYNVRLDIDAYLNSTDDIASLLADKSKQNKMNDLLFEIYVSMLTEQFVSLLSSDEDFDDNIMLGVERND